MFIDLYMYILLDLYKLKLCLRRAIPMQHVKNMTQMENTFKQIRKQNKKKTKTNFTYT